MATIKLNHAVIHELVKIQHKPIQKSIIRSAPLDPKNATVSKVLDEVTSVYGRKQNSAHYGIFSTKRDSGEFPKSFDHYATINRASPDEFMIISRSVMENLYNKAESINAASGGYLLFADYEHSNNHFFMIAMIKGREGFRLSKNLEPEELLELDLTRLNQAARINLNKYNLFKVAKPEDRSEINYLSFVSPSSSQSAAGYFVTALGCAKGTAAAAATTSLIKETSVFFEKTPELKQFKGKFREDLVEHLSLKKPGDSIRLSEVEKLARKYIPSIKDGQADKIAEDLLEYLNGEEHAIPVEFPVNQATVQKFTHVSYKDETIQLKFEKLAFGDSADASIYYDKSKKRLIFNNIPTALSDLLEVELSIKKSEKPSTHKP